MAKKPTAKADTTTNTEATPAQPWAAPGATVSPSPATSEDAKPADEVPAEVKDQVTPSGANPSEQVNEKLGDGATGNGSGVGSDPAPAADADQLDAPDANKPADETSSIEKDEVTPAAPNPSERVLNEAQRVSAALVTEQGDRVQALPPKEEVLAEAKDQLTPVGEDVSLRIDTQPKPALTNSAVPTPADDLRARYGALSDEDREYFDAELNKLAKKMLDRMERNQKANEFAASMVAGQQVYGNRARRANHDETLGGLSNGNVQLNRRARRQAQRVLAESKAKA